MDVSNPRKITFAFALVLMVLSGCAEDTKEPAPEGFREVSSECSTNALPNRYLVKWKDGSTSIEYAKDRAEFIKEVFEPNAEDIEFAEHDFKVRVGLPATQNLMPSQFGADESWGQSAVEAPAVWSQGVTGSGVIVAVIDSGVDIEHPQLKSRLAVNSREVVNGRDDDGNGLVDDVTGFDFATGSGAVRDGAGHGTHVAGIILADPNVGLSSSQSRVSGVAPDARLLPLDFMDDQGLGTISDAIQAINYAVRRGAKVINASWGGGVCSESLRRAISDLGQKGILFVTAAGNSGLNLDFSPEYPAAFQIGAQLTVAATSARDMMAGFSNYSYDRVHLGAPGINIVSTLPGARTGPLSGTSMAAPFVSGAAALLWSRFPQATLSQVRQALLTSVDRDRVDPRGVLAVQSGGRLNVRKALNELERLVQ